MNEQWKNFKGNAWQTKTDVFDFIKNNYTPYDGSAEFLAKPTKRTISIRKKLEDLLKQECDNGGVLSVNTETVCGLLSFKPGYVDKKKDIIVGLQTEKPLERAINPFGGIRMAMKACQEYGYEISPKILEEFQYRTTHNDGVFRMYSEEMRKARKCGIITGLPDAYGRGRLIGDYRRVALYGMNYLIEEKKRDKARLLSENLNADNLQLIEEVSKQISFMEQSIEMAKQYGYDISVPASNAKEAVQWLYFGYLCSVKEQNGAANSIGRISSFLDIYFERDLKAGVLTEEQAQEIIDDFVVKLRLVRHLRTSEYNELFAGDPTWVTISEGGMLNTKQHMVTKTSFRILQTLYNLGSSPEPNITILWNEKLPKGFKDFCAQVSIDTDSIQYENDAVISCDYGNDYSIACCVSALKNGQQMQYFGARCNLAKTLLFALNGGKDELSGVQVGPVSEPFAEGLLNYNDVLKAYKKYRSWIARLYVNTLNLIHFNHDRYAYERFTMSLYDTEIERLMAFGVSGFSVLADSLSAIKHAKVYAIKNKDGLITDFKIEGDFPKFGNDDDRVDKIASWIADDFLKELQKTPCYRNAKHTLSILTITSNVLYGKKTGSTPDGRKAGEPFAPGANPMHGRDLSGAIASLNSVAKVNFKSCKDGVSNTFNITPNVLGDTKEKQIATLVTVLDGYFKKGAHHLNVNVFNRELLEDAMVHPEKYPTLTIRVSGYAVRFTKLTKEQQQEVINRTFHVKM